MCVCVCVYRCLVADRECVEDKDDQPVADRKLYI